MLRTYAKACAIWLCRFLYIQSFLSLISLPILIAWGLPFSYGTALGNLIFSPIIMFFLLIASLVFFCHLIAMPFGGGVWLLEHVSALWSWALTFSNSAWLAYFACPSKALLLLIPSGACLLIMRLAPYPIWVKSAVMTGCLIVTCCILHLSSYIMSPTIAVLPCARGDITFIYKHKRLIMIDAGGMSALKGVASWTQYTCVPYIAKAYGRMHIDDLIVLKATTTTLKTIIALHETMSIGNLYIAGQVVKDNQELAHTLASLPIRVISLDHDHVLLGNGQRGVRGTITSLSGTAKKHGTVRYMMTVDGVIDNEAVTIYPSGYTQRNKDVYN